MSALSKQVGRYLHAEGMRREVAFPNGRSFTVVMAGAYDAGIIGPEHNGLVVLDADNGSVVLDRHVPESSGYHGPSRRQVEEFERVTAMKDWREFAEFMKSARNYRNGSVPDIDEPEPNAPDEFSIVFKAASNGTVPGLPGKDILPKAAAEAHDDPALPLAFPLRTRLDIVAGLAAHAFHADRRSFHLAWNIKVHSPDTSGRTDGYKPDEAFDGLWDAYVQKNAEHVFQQAAEDGLREYLDGSATSYLGEEGGSFEFAVGGRSGGWLELVRFQGRDMSFGSMGDVVETLLEMDEDDLARLYVGVVSFDRNIDAEAEMAHQFAFQRECKEEEWQDPDVAEEAASEAGLDGWTHPSRNTLAA